MLWHPSKTAALRRYGSVDACANMDLTYKLGRFSTLESALFAVGCALGEHEMGGVNVIFVRQAAVHGLARYLLVPLPICACYCHRRVRLERKTRIILYITVMFHTDLH